MHLLPKQVLIRRIASCSFMLIWIVSGCFRLSHRSIILSTILLGCWKFIEGLFRVYLCRVWEMSLKKHLGQLSTVFLPTSSRAPVSTYTVLLVRHDLINPITTVYCSLIFLLGVRLRTNASFPGSWGFHQVMEIKALPPLLRCRVVVNLKARRSNMNSHLISWWPKLATGVIQSWEWRAQCEISCDLKEKGDQGRLISSGDQSANQGRLIPERIKVLRRQCRFLREIRVERCHTDLFEISINILCKQSSQYYWSGSHININYA